MNKVSYHYEGVELYLTKATSAYFRLSFDSQDTVGLVKVDSSTPMTTFFLYASSGKKLDHLCMKTAIDVSDVAHKFCKWAFPIMLLHTDEAKRLLQHGYKIKKYRSIYDDWQQSVDI